MIRFGSVCSGIEAASVALNPIGFEAAWLAEIEPFPSALLKDRFPSVTNLGDMTTIISKIESGEIEAPEMLCGGTPCQAFSVAGLRKSLDDSRGNLTLTFCEIANAIDTARVIQGRDPAVILWENVPGVLNTRDNAFGCFLGALAGEDCPLIAPGGRWSNAGYVSGPQRSIAWRVLDAQYFGLAQRRKRVFVVASARIGFDPTAVLFESEGMRRDSPPSREAGKAAPTIPSRSTAGGGLGTDFDCDGGLIADVVATLDASYGRLQGCSGQDAKHGHSHLIAFSCKDHGEDASDICPTLRSMGHDGSHANGGGQVAVAFAIQAGALRENPASGPDGVGVQADHAYTLEARAEVQAVAFQTRGSNIDVGQNTTGTIGTNCDRASGSAPCVAFNMHKSAHGASSLGISEDRTDCLRAFEKSPFAVQPAGAMQVRRLTPRECERLQGFPDDWTLIPWRGKPRELCPDGPRYKALGNSWAVPVVRWIGRRIAAELKRISESD